MKIIAVMARELREQLGYTEDQALFLAGHLHPALREAGALAEWRPIETAPKDKPVLLWGPYASHPVAAQWSQDDWVCVTDGGWAIESQGDTWTEYATMSVPTHWMPLPRPPAPEQGGERP